MAASHKRGIQKVMQVTINLGNHHENSTFDTKRYAQPICKGGVFSSQDTFLLVFERGLEIFTLAGH